MTQEALKLALEVLEDFSQKNFYDNGKDEIGSLVCCEVLSYKAHDENCKAIKAITAIKQALAHEQEPVGNDWTPCMKLPVVVYVRKQRLGESHVSTREGITPVKPDDLIMRGVSGEEYPIGRAIFEQTYSLNTTPPQRTWVGLTDEERLKLYRQFEDCLESDGWEYEKAIEAKLKDKNCAG